MIEIETDGYKFQFTDAIEVFKFDETDSSKPTFHGAPMKGVDIVAEFDDEYIYVEIKDYDDLSVFDVKNASTDEETKSRQDNFKWLKTYLKYKYRDSYLFRYAEHKVEKPVHYICLINFDNALNNKMRKDLSRELPVGYASRRWQQPIAKSCQVLNFKKWNENFPKWHVTPMPKDNN